MANSIRRTKMQIITEFGWFAWYFFQRFFIFLMINLWIQHLEITNGRTKMADQKLNLNINLGEIQYMGASSWHYWL